MSVLVSGWISRRRRVKRIWIAEAACSTDGGHTLLMGGKATIAAAGGSIVGAPRIIDLGTRTGREAERSPKKRNNELNRFHHLHGSPPCLLRHDYGAGSNKGGTQVAGFLFSIFWWLISVLVSVLMPRWILRRRRIKRILFAKAAYSTDGGATLLD